jgi:hypothetical protein
MEDGNEIKDVSEKTENDKPFSKVVRAGKRTYFFDIKTTQRNDFYITITESKKKYNRDGRFIYEKHLVYLYKEDFQAFLEGLTEIIEHVKSMPEDTKIVQTFKKLYQKETIDQKESDVVETIHDFEEVAVDSYTNVDFDDLGEKKKK